MISIKNYVWLLFILGVNSFAQQASYEKLDEFLTVLDEHNKFMGTIAVTKNNSLEFSKTIGFADVADNKINQLDTKFRIGSITKAFTAVMIFQLIDEGKLAIDTPLSNFFPQVENASKIKISNLLNHSSGLFNITNANNVDQWIYKETSRDEMLSRIIKFETNFLPGDKTEYSNTNYILLGYIVEDLDENIYENSLKRRIIEKINLNNTYYGSTINTNNNEANSYTIRNGECHLQLETHMTNPGGAGAIVSTSNDLTAFMNALFEGRLMSEKSFKTMKTTSDEDTCHGIFYANMNGVDIYASEGGIDGFQSMLVHVPATKTTIALNSNALDFSKMRIMLSAFAVSHGQPITMPKFNKIKLTNEEAKLYEGEYACDEVPYKLVFKAEGNILLGAPEQSDLKELTPTKQHQFTFDKLGIILDFYPETGLVRFTQANNKPLIFKKQ